MSFELTDAIIVEIIGDYDLVKEMFRWEIDNNIPRFRGGFSGRGDYLAYFPSDQREAIETFFSDKENKQPEDDF